MYFSVKCMCVFVWNTCGVMGVFLCVSVFCVCKAYVPVCFNGFVCVCVAFCVILDNWLFESL